MGIGSTGDPIRLGLLQDFTWPPATGFDTQQDFRDACTLVFEEARASGLLDRDVELIERDANGLPIGDVKSVIDAYGELVDEGCLAVFGPHISENTIALLPELERRFRVPSISLCGSDDWLGKWSFALNNGSMTDEPIVLAHLAQRAGAKTTAVLAERSIIGQQYLRNFRDACRDIGLRIVAEETIAQTGQSITDAVLAIHEHRPDSIVHLGFGFGVMQINEALASVDWDPPRYMGTAFEDAYFSDEIWDAFVGWVGLEQYDEGNQVGQQFLDRFEARFGRRPEYYATVCVRDAAVAFARAFANAEPLSPAGVRKGLERVKMVPAASGAPGTAISFGRWTRRGWMGSGYLVARAFEPDRRTSRLVARYEP